MNSNYKYILLLLCMSSSFFSAGQSDFFRKMGVGLETQIGMGVFGTPILVEKGGSNLSQSIDSTLNVTIGIEGRGDFWVLQNKNIGAAVFGEISRGWLGKNTHAYQAYGYRAFIRLKKIRFDTELSSRYRNTFRNFNREGEDFLTEVGSAVYDKINRQQIGLTFINSFDGEFKIAIFRESFTNNDLSAIGAQLSYGGSSIGYLYLSGIINHPVYNSENQFLGKEVPTLPSFSVGYRKTISFHKKSYVKLFGRE